ncbi:MAG: exopolysaccharide biosynthesis polyprenyl glycosylphosphotransferase [Clostridiales bacterium]|nr:exopolysaccharide biosynthesis polyprenyl glycosylphosphotransferase [Clostridiales bacterium]
MKRENLIISLSKLTIIAFMVLSIYECFMLFYNPLIEEEYLIKGQVLIAGIYLALYLLSTGIYEAFDIRLNRISDIVYSQILSVLIPDTIMYLIMIFVLRGIPDFLPALATLAVQICFILIWSFFSKKIYIKNITPLKTIVVFDGETDIEQMIIKYNLETRFDVQKKADINECFENPGLLDGFDAVFLCDNNSEKRNKILIHCVENGKNVFVNPNLSDMVMHGAKAKHILYLPIMNAGKYEPDAYYLIAKRLFDFFMSLILLIILSPVLAITAIAVKICDAGPVFYKQTRMTKDGKNFKIIKFRSMRVDAEKNGAQLSSGENDDRITPVGKFIRKIRLDELPQLINILKGDMSFVGPRPERPEIAEKYYEDLPEFALRLQVKAGLTGYAQVYGKYNTTAYDKLKMDLMYIAHPTIANDASIILATLKILFVPESTEGVEN